MSNKYLLLIFFFFFLCGRARLSDCCALVLLFIEFSLYLSTRRWTWHFCSSFFNQFLNMLIRSLINPFHGHGNVQSWADMSMIYTVGSPHTLGLIFVPRQCFNSALSVAGLMVPSFLNRDAGYPVSSHARI